MLAMIQLLLGCVGLASASRLIDDELSESFTPSFSGDTPPNHVPGTLTGDVRPNNLPGTLTGDVRPNNLPGTLTGDVRPNHHPGRQLDATPSTDGDGSSGLTSLEDQERLQSLKLDEADVKAGRAGTEVVMRDVFRVQRVSFPRLYDSNAAFELGLLAFMSNYADPETLTAEVQVIVWSKVEMLLDQDSKRAERHYIKYNDDIPDKDPKLYNINTVGLWMSRKGGWLSFPKRLRCDWGKKVGHDCAWDMKQRIKSIHATCLLQVKDDGPDGTGKAFSDVAHNVKVPPGSDINEEQLTEDTQVALKILRKAFLECPDVWESETIFSTIGLKPAYTKAESERRCCCFNDQDHNKRFPKWARDSGICLPDSGGVAMFAGMWRMIRAGEKSSLFTCSGGKARYVVDRKSGRCLPPYRRHKELQYHDWEKIKTSEANFGTESHPYATDMELTHKQVHPRIVKSATRFFGKQLFVRSDIFVCDSNHGLHHAECDCSWANDEC